MKPHEHGQTFTFGNPNSSTRNVSNIPHIDLINCCHIFFMNTKDLNAFEMIALNVVLGFLVIYFS